jgi:hypothetical protein
MSILRHSLNSEDIFMMDRRNVTQEEIRHIYDNSVPLRTDEELAVKPAVKKISSSRPVNTASPAPKHEEPNPSLSFLQKLLHPSSKGDIIAAAGYWVMGASAISWGLSYTPLSTQAITVISSLAGVPIARWLWNIHSGSSSGRK